MTNLGRDPEAFRLEQLVERELEAGRLHRASPIDELFDAIGGDPLLLPPRTRKLLEGSKNRKARKLVEEATEVAIETLKGRRKRAVQESADLLYHLVVLWRHAGIAPGEVWQEMERRRAELGIAEKLPKTMRKPSTRPAYVGMDRAIGPLYPSKL